MFTKNIIEKNRLNTMFKRFIFLQKSYEGKSLLFLSVILILLNSEEEKFANTPLYSTDGQGMNAEVLVKYFNPCGSGVPKTVK